MQPIRAVLLQVLIAVTNPVSASSQVAPAATSSGLVTVERMADGLVEPWGLAFLPDGRFLVTERDGRLVLFPASGGRQIAAIEGMPEVVAKGQGGLLDVLVPKDFERTREILFSYANPQGAGAGTALGVGRLSPDERRLEDVRLLFQMRAGSSGGRHFGSRIVEAEDGTLFLTIGDRGTGDLAQDPARHEGAVVHLARDGQPVAPGLFGPDALPELYSKGHRNPQGAALDAKGDLWVVEHGARGGDELNRVEPGRNYGWPLISYGRNYDGSRIGSGPAGPGLEQPAHYWDPSIAPSGLTIYSGKLFRQWRGDIFTGSLKLDYISRLDPDAGFAEERLKTPQTGRVRDIREAPDGTIWFLSVGEGAVFRLSPAN